MQLIEVPRPIEVSEDFYNTFKKMVDADNLQPFDLGYELGAQENQGGGSSEDLEALGVLCDWEITSSSRESEIVVSIINYHPTYYLHCQVSFNQTLRTEQVVVSPDSSASIALDGLYLEDGDSLEITNVRWTANET